jgi:hypothetical protein
VRGKLTNPGECAFQGDTDPAVVTIEFQPGQTPAEAEDALVAQEDRVVGQLTLTKPPGGGFIARAPRPVPIGAIGVVHGSYFLYIICDTAACTDDALEAAATTTAARLP